MRVEVDVVLDDLPGPTVEDQVRQWETEELPRGVIARLVAVAGPTGHPLVALIGPRNAVRAALTGALAFNPETAEMLLDEATNEGAGS